MRGNRKVPKLLLELSIYLLLQSSEISAQNSTAASLTVQEPKDEILKLSESPVVLSTNITVQWSTQNIDNDVYYYEIFLTQDGILKNRRTVSATENKIRRSFIHLKPCIEYNITIIALCKDKSCIGLRDTKNVNTSSEPPPAVTKLISPKNESGKIFLTWERPATDCEITAYTITYSGVTNWGPRPVHTGNATIGHEDANSATSAAIDGLQPYTDYTVVVTAATVAGGGEGKSIIVTTLQGVPSLPIEVNATSKSPTTITVWWMEPQEHNGVLGPYKVIWFKDGQMVGSSDIHTHHFTITGLVPCVEYSVMVAASTGAGVGEGATVNKTTITEASHPSCAPNSNPQTILVTWTKPSTSCAITNYVVSWPNKTVTVDSSTLQHTIRNTSGQEISEVCVTALVAEERGERACCGQPRSQFDEEAEIENKNSTTGIVVGVVVAGLVVVAVLVVVVIFKRDVLPSYLCSNHNEKESSPSLDQRRHFSDPLNDPDEDDRVVTRRNWPSRAPSDVPMPKLTPEEIGLTEDTFNTMGVENLIYSVYSVTEEYYTDLESRVSHQLEALKDPAKVATEFDSLNRASFVGETSAGKLPINMRKNRYINILPFDFNRVRLRNAPGNTTDYINASYVQSTVAEDVGFIACQSPKANTVSDFWWMVWEQNIRIIVMLVRSDEGEETKCTQYWPVLCEQSFASLVLKTENKETTGGLIVRNMLLRNDRETRAVRHFQFTSWPDFGVPASENDLLMLVKEIRENIQPDMRHIVVHCSAGVGRTGTLIALWQLQVQAERRMPGVDVKETVLELRRHRTMLVQKPEQYYFLHSCFLKYLQEMSIWKPTLEASHFSEMSRLTMTTAV